MDAAGIVPMIRGEKIWLRPLEQRDLEQYRRCCNDNDIAQLAGYPHPYSQAIVERWFEKVKAQHGNDAFYFTVCPLGQDDFLGTAWLRHIDLLNGSAEFSIFIGDKTKWGQGYGTDALNAIVDFGFGELPLENLPDGE